MSLISLDRDGDTVEGGAPADGGIVFGGAGGVGGTVDMDARPWRENVDCPKRHVAAEGIVMRLFVRE